MSRFEFDEIKHAYKLDGKRLVGVTTVLGTIAKPGLIGWAAKMACERIEQSIGLGLEVTPDLLDEAEKAHTRKRDGAANVGTRVHKAIEHHMIGQEPDLETDQEWEMFNNLRVWAEARIEHVIATEIRVFHEELGYAGTCDLVFEDQNGDVWAADWKTSAKMYDRVYFAQCAAYIEAMKSMEFEWADRIKGCYIAMAGKDGSFTEKRSEDMEKDFGIFQAALFLYRNNKMSRAKKYD